MHPLADIHRIIRFLESKVDALPNENSREFVDNMVKRLNADGDSFYCSPKQVRYLRSLALRLGMDKEMAPKTSRLQELKEKRRKLLNRSYKDRCRQQDADHLTIFVVPELRHLQIQTVSARMRRDRSYKNAIAVANSKPKGEGEE